MTKRQGYFLIGVVWVLIATHFDGFTATKERTLKERIAFLTCLATAGYCFGKGFETKDTSRD